VLAFAASDARNGAVRAYLWVTQKFEKGKPRV